MLDVVSLYLRVVVLVQLLKKGLSPARRLDRAGNLGDYLWDREVGYVVFEFVLSVIVWLHSPGYLLGVGELDVALTC